MDLSLVPLCVVCVCVLDLVFVVEILQMLFKGELNIDKKWQSDDLFYIIMNESRPRVDQFLSNYKEIV